MRKIVPGIRTLEQHILTLKNNRELYRPDCCDECGSTAINFNGCYPRKPDRRSPAHKNLNPIPIPRFICKDCGASTSTLPEAIPQRHWYHWNDKQEVMENYLAKENYRSCSRIMENRPSRPTISRWCKAWKSRWVQFRQVLNETANFITHLLPENHIAGYIQALREAPLSSLMLICHEKGLAIP